MAIPTTAETATGVTPNSVIFDESKGVPYFLNDYNLTSEVVVMDPELITSLSSEAIADSGMLVLSVAVESYVSTAHSIFTDPMALKAAKMVFDYLPAALQGDMEAEKQIFYAHCLGAVAFSNANFGIAHSLGHATDRSFPSSKLGAAYLPYVIKFNSFKDSSRYADIARFIGFQGKDDKDLTESLCSHISELISCCRLPLTIKDAGISQENFRAQVCALADRAIKDTCTAYNPRPVTQSEMEKLLSCAYDGTKPCF